LAYVLDPHEISRLAITVAAGGHVRLTRSYIPSNTRAGEPTDIKIEGHVENAIVKNPVIALAYISGPADYVRVHYNGKYMDIPRGNGAMFKGYYRGETKSPCTYIRSWEGGDVWKNIVFPKEGEYILEVYSGTVRETSSATAAEEIPIATIKTTKTEEINWEKLALPLAVGAGGLALLYFISR